MGLNRGPLHSSSQLRTASSLGTMLSSMLGSFYELQQPLLNARPLRSDSRIPHRIAWDEVCGHSVDAENSLELPADAFERGAGTLVTGVGVKADAEHFPQFEGVREHQQFGLGVGGGADRGTGQPRISNLARVRTAAPVRRMVRRPRPSLDVPEARRTDHRAAVDVDYREGHRAAGVSPCQGGVDISVGLGLRSRNGTPLVKRGIGSSSGDEAVDVAVLKRLQPNVAALQKGTVGGQIAISADAMALATNSSPMRNFNSFLSRRTRTHVSSACPS